MPAEAGVIPRAVRQIFDTLEAQNADYSMKVTFLELYNEEVTDLLAPEEYSKSAEDRQKKPISLMEDGKGCVIVRGLEEEAVYSVNEIYTLLERGAAKRRTADTLLNKRSRYIFANPLNDILNFRRNDVLQNLMFVAADLILSFPSLSM